MEILVFVLEVLMTFGSDVYSRDTMKVQVYFDRTKGDRFLFFLLNDKLNTTYSFEMGSWISLVISEHMRPYSPQ